MEFLAALIAVMLVQLWGSGAPLHRDNWFMRLCQKLSAPLGDAPTLLILAAISLPVFVVLVVYYGIADQWWGLPKLILLVLILLYSLGRGDFKTCLEQYMAAWRRGDTEAALMVLEQSDGAQPLATESLPALHAQARAQFFYRGFERMFAVLFWFAVAGPALALAYRLAFLYRERAVTAVAADNRLALALAEQLLALFEWVPARLLGLSFVVVGSFADGLRAWIDQLQQHGASARNYLDAVAASVLGYENPDAMLEASRSETEFLSRAEDELKQLQIVLNRAMVLWLATMALIQVVL
jgi:AmpE protein